MCKEVKWTVKFFFFLWIKLKQILTFDRFKFKFIHGGKMGREVRLSLFKYALLFYFRLIMETVKVHSWITHGEWISFLVKVSVLFVSC